MGYHFLVIRLVKIYRYDNIKYWLVYREMGTLKHSSHKRHIFFVFVFFFFLIFWLSHVACGILVP